MIRADLDQRIQEIGLSLSETFEPERASLVRKYDAGKACLIRLSWVVNSPGDTTLDSHFRLPGLR
jgi:hypothetical protein